MSRAPSKCGACGEVGHTKDKCPHTSTSSGGEVPVVMTADAHPLFPAEGNAPAPEVHFISVQRDGQSVPRTFAAAELLSLEQLHSLYGGGSYKLYARNRTASGQAGHVLMVRYYTLPGAPLPLAPVQASPMAPPLPGASVDPQNPMSMMMWMMMQAQQREEARAEREEAKAERRAQADREAADRQMNMLIAVLGRAQPAAPQTDPALIAALTAAANRPDNTAAIISALSQKNSQENNAAQMIATLKDGLQIGKEVASKQETTAEIIAAIAPAVAPIITTKMQIDAQKAQGAPAQAGGEFQPPPGLPPGTSPYNPGANGAAQQ